MNIDEHYILNRLIYNFAFMVGAAYFVSGSYTDENAENKEEEVARLNM